MAVSWSSWLTRGVNFFFSSPSRKFPPSPLSPSPSFPKKSGGGGDPRKPHNLPLSSFKFKLFGGKGKRWWDRDGTFLKKWKFSSVQFEQRKKGGGIQLLSSTSFHGISGTGEKESQNGFAGEIGGWGWVSRGWGGLCC